MGRLRWFVVLCALVVASLSGAQPAAGAAPPTLDDGAKRALMLQSLERFVPFAERYWRASDLTIPRTGYYAAAGPGVTQPRGAGNVAEVYATLLTARPDAESFAGVPREVLLDRTIQSIRHEAATNKLAGTEYSRWGGGTWQASLETYGWAFAAKLLWDELDDDTKALVEKVVVGEADILITKAPARGVVGNTGAEDNGWNAPMPALASTMFPDHANREAWDEAARRHAINATTREADRNASTPVLDGKPLSAWFHGAVVHPDLTMENHGFFNPIYQQVTHAKIAEGAVMLAHAGRSVPDAFSFRVEEVWDRILGPIAADDGDLILTAGQDWTSKDYQHLLYLSTLSTRFKRADASLAESRALKMITRRQAARPDGAYIGQPQLGYESMIAKRMASAWWNHELFGPSPVPTEADLAADRERTGGVREYPYISTVQGPMRDAFVSMSWDDTQAMGLIVPTARGHEDDPIFTAYTPRSLVGAASGVPGPYTCDCREDRFSTAGTIGARRFSMTAFADGVTMLLDRGTGATFNLAFERIAGLTGERPVHHEDGQGLGDLPGTWANVADRLGIVVAGGGGLRAADVNAANPYRRLDGSKDTGTGNRGALLLPASDRAETRTLADTVTQPETPDAWSALYGRAPDGTGRLAIARWSGDADATVTLRDERGAPLTSAPSTVEGGVARATFSLGTPASRGETVRFFVRSDGRVLARAIAEDRAELVNDTDAPVRARATYVAPGGETHTVERVLAAGEQTPVRPVAGELIAAGAEYEGVRSARDRMAALAAQVAAWRADGTLSAGQASGTRTRAVAAREALDRALTAGTAVTPDTDELSASVDAATHHVRLLDAGDAPPEVRSRVAADRQAALEALERAQSGLGVLVRVVTGPTALQGEPLTVRAVLFNRSRQAAQHAALRLTGPEGWGAAEPAVATIEPGETRTVTGELTVPPTAQGGSVATVTGTLSYRLGDHTRTRSASANVTIRPALELVALHPVLPLAVGGWNEATVRLANNTEHHLEVTLAATAADGITADVPSAPVVVPARSSTETAIGLRNASRASGESTLLLTATAGSRRVEEPVELRHSANLALNGLAAPWPAPFASNWQGSYPPPLATDGTTATFWVSETAPSASNPAVVGVDFGRPVTVGRVIMRPRPNYGPRTYTVEVDDGDGAWRVVGTETFTSATAATTTTFPATEARRLRLRVTVGHDRNGAARNVQVAELDVRGG